MCLAIPGKVLEVETNPEGVRMGRDELWRHRQAGCLEYTPEVSDRRLRAGPRRLRPEQGGRGGGGADLSLLEEMKQLGELETPDGEAAFVADERPPPS